MGAEPSVAGCRLAYGAFPESLLGISPMPTHVCPVMLVTRAIEEIAMAVPLALLVGLIDAIRHPFSC